MMGKQINRMRQLARQNILKAEKTEVLNDDLQLCEKKVDQIKDACQKTVKKLSACMQGSGQDVEKRTRKLPHTVLGQSMQDCSLALGSNSVFGLTLEQAADIWTNIGIELTSHEMGLENIVLVPFNQLLDNEIPSIMSLKRKLNKLILDLDSAKQRYQTASSKQFDKEHLSKLEAIREEMEQCQWKVDACKETLATEMMSLVAKDGMLGRCLVDMVESQAQYHRNVLARLEKLIPRLRDNLTEAPSQGVFGLALEDHLRLQGREIASPIETCIFWILELGIDEEGLFRIAGSASKMKLIRAALDANVAIDMDLGLEHALAGVLKQYLRELPDPLLTYALYSDLTQTLAIKDKDQKLMALKAVLQKLPQANYNNFRYLIKFLSRVAGRSEQNKMNASNISLVVGPNCVWSEEDGGMSVISSGVSASIIEYFITYADWFFPEDINFTMTSPKINSEGQPPIGVDGTDGAPAPAVVVASPPPSSEDHHAQLSPAQAVAVTPSSPVGHSPAPQVQSPPQLDGSPLSHHQHLSDKLKASSLPRRSQKKNPAPPVPHTPLTASQQSSSLPRDLPAATTATSAATTATSPIPSDESRLNGNGPAVVAAADRPEPPDRPSKMDKPPRLDRPAPAKADKPPLLEKPARPPVPVKKNSLGREVTARPSSSPPSSSSSGSSSYDNIPPSPTLRPKSTNLSRPTISPPPPPPPPKSPKPGAASQAEIPEEGENTQF